MTNADWITEKITNFFKKNKILIFKINIITFILCIILFCITKRLYFIPILVFSIIFTIGFGIDFIDEWMEQEHKAEDIKDD